MTPHLPKTHPIDSREALADFARTHWFCQACGADYRPLQVHHILGGRCGRSDEPCNLLRVCGHPCHLLAEQLDVPDDLFEQRSGRVLLPKIFDGMALSMKLRVGELIEADLARLSVLNLGRPLDLLPIPEWFVDQFKRNRPELCL